SDATTLSGGVRYTDEEKDFIGTTTMSIFGNPDSEIGDAAPASVPAGMLPACDNWPECFYDPSGEFENTSYRIALDHNFTDDLMAFVSYSTGFKSGGWSPDCLPNFARGACYAAVDEEELATIELGIRSEFENVRVNLTYFMNTYDDLQLAATLPGRGFTRFNVEEVEVAGLEAELSGQINEYFSWFGNASWLDTEFSEVSQDIATAIAGGGPCQGNADVIACVKGLDLKNAPDYSYTLGFVFDRPMGDNNLQISASVAQEADSFTAASNNENVKRDETTLVDARISLMDAENVWAITLWGKNITDEEYNRTGTTGGGGFIYAADPAHFGLTLSANF
ncbi:MAG: TonB-dependent receptor, partial [Alphaproteobacteria bacterium]|nr:TonB-dependent receptor [Alphaproteobacteria bacterium]